MQKYFSPSFWTAVLLSVLYKLHNTFNVLLIVLIKTIKIWIRFFLSYLHKYKYPFYCGAEMYSSLVFSLPYDSLPLYSSYLLQARNQKSLLDIDSVQSSLLGVRGGEKALFSIMVSGVFELTFFCLSVYLPNTGPTFQFLRWKNHKISHHTNTRPNTPSATCIFRVPHNLVPS